MVSLFLRNLFFTVLQPGVVVGLIPYLILGRRAVEILGQPWRSWHYIATVLFALGFTVMTVCIVSFAVHGRGTLSPADPARKLVARGLYRYSRNPMYVGVMAMLIAESVFFESGMLWAYSLAVFILFNLFIRYFEEPRLMRDFGGEYASYCKRVRMWL